MIRTGMYITHRWFQKPSIYIGTVNFYTDEAAVLTLSARPRINWWLTMNLIESPDARRSLALYCCGAALVQKYTAHDTLSR